METHLEKLTDLDSQNEEGDMPPRHMALLTDRSNMVDHWLL